MKKLIIVSGTMGVGKSSVCKLLYKMAPRTAWLDGDWCWLMYPWDTCAENKEMALNNISNILMSYLANSTIDSIVFSWVLHRKEIIDDLLGRLSQYGFELRPFILECSPQQLARRMEIDGRDSIQILQSIERLSAYKIINWVMIDTTSIDACETAARIAKMAGLL
jgi:hypothetical protein